MQTHQCINSNDIDHYSKDSMQYYKLSSSLSAACSYQPPQPSAEKTTSQQRTANRKSDTSWWGKLNIEQLKKQIFFLASLLERKNCDCKQLLPLLESWVSKICYFSKIITDAHTLTFTVCSHFHTNSLWFEICWEETTNSTTPVSPSLIFLWLCMIFHSSAFFHLSSSLPISQICHVTTKRKCPVRTLSPDSRLSSPRLSVTDFPLHLSHWCSSHPINTLLHSYATPICSMIWFGSSSHALSCAHTCT